MSASGLHSVFDRFSGLMRAGRRVLSRHVVHDGVPDAQIGMAVTRLHVVQSRMERLVALWKAGKLVIRPRRKRTQPPAPVDPNAPIIKRSRLSRAFGWLAKRIKPDGYGFAAELAAMIAEPEMEALLAAAPQAGRMLRPLCQMYGVKADGIALPKRPRRKRPAKPDAAAEARKAERAEAAEERELSKTSSRKSPVPPGHTFPTTARGWAIYNRRAKRQERERRSAHFKKPA